MTDTNYITSGYSDKHLPLYTPKNMSKKPKHHEVTAEELRQFMNDDYTRFASSSREGKRLIVNHHGHIKVRGPGGIVYEGHSVEAAVDFYNSITAKYEKPQHKL